MGWTLKDKIFGYFGNSAKTQDSFKDSNGKGIWERYNESLGEDYDENMASLIDNLADNTIVPATILPTLIPLMEYMLGNPVRVLDTLTMRRKILKFTQDIYNIKGTKLSYQVLMRLLGFDMVDIQEFVVDSGLDSDLTLDDPTRTLDGSSRACTQYSILLTGSIVVTADIIEALIRIDKFLRPIMAELIGIYYNGDLITTTLINVQIIGGVLYYDNMNDPDIILDVTDGILSKDGASAIHYLLVNGVLYYQNP